MANGKLESLITIPSGGWDVTITDADGGASIVSLVADKTYYWSAAGNDSVDLPAKLTTLFEEEHDGGEAGWSVTIDATEGGTGKVTISVSTGTFTISWDNTDLRDLLGFDGTELVSEVASATGNDHAHSLWLPDCPPTLPFGTSDEGWDESDAVTTISPTGAMVSTVYNTRVATSIHWQMVANNKARTADETTTNESFQTFYKQCILGTKDWATAGGPVNWHADADTDATYVNYGVQTQTTLQPEKTNPQYDAWYVIRMPRLVKVP